MKKAININNSYYSNNYNLYNCKVPYVLVVKENSKQVKELVEHSLTDTIFVIKRGYHEDAQLEQLIFNSGANVVYYTETTVPTGIMSCITNYKHTMFLYKLPPVLDDDLCDNIHNAFSVASTAFVVSRDDNEPWELLFCRLCKARFNVDRIFLAYSNLDTDKIFDDYIALHEPLARWRMYLYLPYETDKQRQTLNRYVGVKKHVKKQNID